MFSEQQCKWCSFSWRDNSSYGPYPWSIVPLAMFFCTLPLLFSPFPSSHCSIVSSLTYNWVFILMRCISEQSTMFDTISFPRSSSKKWVVTLWSELLHQSLSFTYVALTYFNVAHKVISWKEPENHFDVIIRKPACSLITTFWGVRNPLSCTSLIKMSLITRNFISTSRDSYHFFLFLPE